MVYMCVSVKTVYGNLFTFPNAFDKVFALHMPLVRTHRNTYLLKNHYTCMMSYIVYDYIKYYLNIVISRPPQDRAASCYDVPLYACTLSPGVEGRI